MNVKESIQQVTVPYNLWKVVNEEGEHSEAELVSGNLFFFSYKHM